MLFTQRSAKTAALLAAALLVTSVTAANAAPLRRAVMQSPAEDAAMVISMPGLINAVPELTLSGKERTLNDGIVIRKTVIKDGKIHIPPSGLYVTVRSSNWIPFDNEPLYLAGKKYYFITDQYARDVVRNISMTPGQILGTNPDKTRGWQLDKISKDSFGVDGAYSATFKILKTTGNFYGSTITVYDGPLVTNDVPEGKLNQGTSAPEGRTVPTAENGLSHFISGSKVGTVGRSTVVVDEITPIEVKVRELSTDSCTNAYISPTAPVIASYAKGDTFTVGNAKVEVSAVDANSATIKMTDNGKEVTKTFGPMTTENMEWMPMSMVARDKFWVLAPDGKEIVHLNVSQPELTFANGKVSLVAYQDVVSVENGVWEADNRFLARPET